MSRSQSFRSISMALALAAFMALVACDKKPSSPPAPKANSAQEGPTAASGGAPSADYPAGIKPAPSGNPVAVAANKGPADGGTAVGGMASGQAATSGNAGAAAPTAGDGKTEPK